MSHIERMNYENDHRVRGAREGDWFESFDERRMVLTVTLYDDDDEEETVELPATYGVCPTCEGKGSHVNPSIDCCGISREDFDEDPEFEENYNAGMYDVQCYQCRGKRVVPEIDTDNLTDDQKTAVERLHEKMEADAEFEAISRAERMMGA